MGKSILFPFVLFAGYLSFSQNMAPEFGFGYVYSSPTRAMNKTISQAHGINLAVGLTTPGQRLTYGVELGYGTYGHESSSQQYTFGDGTTADMDIRVSNGFTNLMATARLNLRLTGSTRPYVLMKGGYSWYQTKLNIYDPNDWDHCEPVDTELIQQDGALVYSLGGGLQFDLSRVFKQLPSDLLFLDLQSSLIQGGRVQYMNSDAPHSTSHHSSTRTSEIQAEFINTQTLITHHHHVGNLYSSFISMLDFRLGLVLRPSNFF